MRGLALMPFVVCLVVSTASVCADEQADLRALIEKGIKARGDADKLARNKALTWKGKGKFHGLGEAIDFTGDWAVQHPGQTRNRLEMDFNGAKFERVSVVNGDKGWIKLNGNLEEMDKDQFAEEKAQAHVGMVAALLALRDKSYQLAPLGEAKVADRPAVGVRVSQKDQRDVSLFLDKETGLLLKSESRVKDPQSGQEATQEMLYSDYRVVDGVKHAMKVTIKRDGKAFVEVEWTDFKAQEKLDDGTFAKP